MQLPLKIATRNLRPTEATVRTIRERVEKLEQFYNRILGCRVVLEGPGGHHRGGRYQVRLYMTVPNTELVIDHQAGEDLNLAIREAFDAAGRRLEDYVRRLRGDVKTIEGPPQARIVRLFPKQGYGFIESNGREIYFHRNSVLPPGFDRLQVGMTVRFSEEQGEGGPQASTVSIAGNSH